MRAIRSLLFSCPFIAIAIFLILSVSLYGARAFGADLTLPSGGRVTVEFVTSGADFSDTLSVFSPTVSIGVSNCGLASAAGLPGVHVLSAKVSRPGCRVDLDADPATLGIQPFAAGTTLEFRLCAQRDVDRACEFVWASNPDLNEDKFDHVRTTPAGDPPVRTFELAWEDLPQGVADEDFDDLIAVVAVSEPGKPGENFTLTTVETPVCDTRTASTPLGEFPLRGESTGVWQNIVRNMLGVEGVNELNHFIGRFPAEKDNTGPGAIDNWWPLDGLKHTMCETLFDFNFFIPGGGAELLGGARNEMDWNNFFIPVGGPFASMFEQARSQYLHTGYTGWKSGGWHLCVPATVTGSSNVRILREDVSNCMEAEITPDQSYFENVLNSKTRKSSILEGSKLCTYGPWVREHLHQNRPEIHPSEQYWWVEQDPSGFFRFFLMQLQDDSGRFDNRDDYAKDPPRSFRPWTAPPFAADFRIAFELDPAAEPLSFEIFRQDAANVVTSQFPVLSRDVDDGTQHAIDYDGKVVLSVTEHQPDDDLGVDFLGVCRNEANTRLQGYIAIRSLVGLNNPAIAPCESRCVTPPCPESIGFNLCLVCRDAFNRLVDCQGYHTVRVQTDELPYLRSTAATVPPIIDRRGSLEKFVDVLVNAIPDSLRRLLGSSLSSQQGYKESAQLVTDFQVQISADPEADPADRTISRVELVSEDEVRGLAFEPGADGGIVRDVPVIESATLRFVMASGAVQTVQVNGLSLAPLVIQEEPMLSQSADPALWRELASIAGSLQETAWPPATIEHIKKWRLDISPFYAPLREGEVAPGEESPFTEELNEVIFKNQVDRVQELFGTSDPFKISWSFRATNLSTNSRVPVFVDALPTAMAVSVQLLDNRRRIEVTFPAKPANNIYELEATAQITDTYGITNIIRHRFWSHALSGDAEQLAKNALPTVAELASESPEEIMSASTSDISGSPLDEVDVPDDIIAKSMDARMVRFGIMDSAEDGQITIDELRHLIRGARIFEPNDLTCLGVPATIVGTDEPDRLVGTATDDVIVGLGGKDVILGGGGDDIICGGGGSDVVMSGTGEDIVDGGPGSDELFGGPDSDQLGGSRGDDMTNGGAGFDVLIGGFGSDTIQGGGDDDMIDGGSGSDEINGGPGSDTIQGGGDDDMIDGGDENDLINGGPGKNTCVNDVTIFC